MEESEKEKKGTDVGVIILSVFGALVCIVVLYLLWTYFVVKNKKLTGQNIVNKLL